MWTRSTLSLIHILVPDTYTTLTDPDQILKMQKLIDALEDNDDVQQVWHNWDAPEEEDED